MTLGTLDGLLANAFTTLPALILLSGVVYLVRRGFFGPHQ